MKINERAQEKYLRAEIRKELGRGWRVTTATQSQHSICFEARQDFKDYHLVLIGTLREGEPDNANAPTA